MLLTRKIYVLALVLTINTVISKLLTRTDMKLEISITKIEKLSRLLLAHVRWMNISYVPQDSFWNNGKCGTSQQQLLFKFSFDEFMHKLLDIQ